MTKIGVDKLTEAQETLLLPLWARATESRRPSPLLRDTKSLELVEAIDYDFDKFARKKVSSLNFCARAALFDNVVDDFLGRHAEGTVVEIGAGLDTRFDRLDNGAVRWFDLDLPAVIEVRKRFFVETERREFLATSVLDRDWIETVKERTRENNSTFFVAEGVFYFFTTQQLIQLFSMLADSFPGSSIVFDSQSPLYAWYSNHRHALSDSRIIWSIQNIKSIESWNPKLKVERSIGFGNSPEYDGLLPCFPRFHRIARRLWPPARNMFRVSVVRLG